MHTARFNRGALHFARFCRRTEWRLNALETHAKPLGSVRGWQAAPTTQGIPERPPGANSGFCQDNFGAVGAGTRTEPRN